jgi:hypothetical protein
MTRERLAIGFWVEVTDLVLVLLCLGVYAAVNFFGGTRLEKDRAVLAVFPLFLLFFLLTWMTMLS